MTAWVLMGIGGFLVTVGTIGVLRFRDVYSRLQASGVSDTAGAVFLLLGLIAQRGLEARDATLALLVVLLLITNPIAAHSIAKSAFTQRHCTGGRE
ncbi:MAG: monovalent cation/H(+) antiporter subunit G [Candidatus Bipolaricaulis sp.]|nr:monovalent cation/H(+) antiporter subunit G [Candidatus Bipolaricaulis sp.]MDD5646033.1 monovalent cation/H(+) antiporter subunit G [Candidatus Bipolaricaulis sp.]